MKNIHITLTDFRNESRVLKEIASLQSAAIFNSYMVIALGANELPMNEERKGSFKLKRLSLCTRNLPKSAPFQLLKFLEFMLKCVWIVRQERPAVVNLHTLALLPLGWMLKKLFGCKLVYDAHELETEKNGLHGFRQELSKWVEHRFIKECDLVIVVGEYIANWYAESYKITKPIVVKNAPFLIERKKHDLFREQLNIKPNQKILLYQGGLVRGRGVHLVLNAFKQRHDDNVVLVFMGYGDLESEVKQAERLNKNIRFMPAVSPEVLLDYTSSADVGIAFIENTCLSYFYCLPNKLFEYAMVGLPVLTSDMKEMADSVTKNNFGVVIKDESAVSINLAVDEILEKDFYEMSDAAYEFASNNSWNHQEKVMLEGYRRMLNT